MKANDASEQYISKSALVAEIKRRIKQIFIGIVDIPLTGRQKADATLEREVFGKVLNIINTLEVKNVDFEEYYQEFLQKKWFGNSHVRKPVRKQFVEKAMTEIEEKAKAFTEAHKGKTSDEILAEMRGEEHVSKVWHDASEMPENKKVCLVMLSRNGGASTNNLEVVISDPLMRRFVTRAYPHKTGYQHTIHGENTIKVDEYQDRRDYIPFSDVDKWADVYDLINL